MFLRPPVTNLSFTTCSLIFFLQSYTKPARIVQSITVPTKRISAAGDTLQEYNIKWVKERWGIG